MALTGGSANTAGALSSQGGVACIRRVKTSIAGLQVEELSDYNLYASVYDLIVYDKVSKKYYVIDSALAENRGSYIKDVGLFAQVFNTATKLNIPVPCEINVRG